MVPFICGEFPHDGSMGAGIFLGRCEPWGLAGWAAQVISALEGPPPRQGRGSSRAKKKPQQGA